MVIKFGDPCHIKYYIFSFCTYSTISCLVGTLSYVCIFILSIGKADAAAGQVSSIVTQFKVSVHKSKLVSRDIGKNNVVGCNPSFSGLVFSPLLYSNILHAWFHHFLLHQSNLSILLPSFI